MLRKVIGLPLMVIGSFILGMGIIVAYGQPQLKNFANAIGSAYQRGKHV